MSDINDPAPAPALPVTPEAPTPPVTKVADTRPKALALVALILAIAGFVLGLIPLIGVLGGIMMFAAVVLAIIALALKTQGGKGMSIAALIIAVVGWIVSIIVFFVALGLAAASMQGAAGHIPVLQLPSSGDSGSTGQNSGGTTAKLGEPFEVKQGDSTAMVTIVSATYGNSDNSSFNTTASNGGFLILDVLWEGKTGTSSANPLYFAVKDADGRSGDIDIFVDGSLDSGDVPTGDKTRGNVAFDVSASGPYTVIITNPLFQEVARVSVTATAK